MDWFNNEEDEEQKKLNANLVPNSPIPQSPQSELMNKIVPPVNQMIEDNKPSALAPPKVKSTDTGNHIGMFKDLMHDVEGYRPDVYLDHKGNPTVGHGLNLNDETVRGSVNLLGINPEDVASGRIKLNQEQLNNIEQRYVQKREPTIKKHIGEIYDILPSNQKAALLSMGYQSLNNIGPTLMHHISNDDTLGAMKEMILNTNKEHNPGILDRRMKEAQLFGGQDNFESVFKIMTPEEKKKLVKIINKTENENTKKELLAKYMPYLQDIASSPRYQRMFSVAER